ncbi:hypothetical protein [Catenuloplanes japonicus]|uniref:hypothetical protein n=1 Tax=Catenuloplanes japonicus TaxID=33876 RepID=UPI00052792E7|nr:hypothetical protein [Catenuloplanes japonicus]
MLSRLGLPAVPVGARLPEGKLLHDPLAFAAVLEPDVFRWAEVSVYRETGQWGARSASGTGTFITVGVEAERAPAVLLN